MFLCVFCVGRMQGDIRPTLLLETIVDAEEELPPVFLVGFGQE